MACPAAARDAGGSVRRREVRRAPRQPQSGQRDAHVQAGRDIGRNRHVVHAQEVETGEQAAEHRPADVAGIEDAEPRYACRRAPHPPRDGRQRGAHQQRRQQQAGRRDEAAKRDVAASHSGIERVDERHAPEQEQPRGAYAQLEAGVHAQRVIPGIHRPRQQEAAETHPAHERAQQHAQRDRRRTDHELQQLEPDHFVDERGAAAADEEQNP